MPGYSRFFSRCAAIALLVSTSLAMLPAAHAEPVADNERIAVDFRRTTLVVEDMAPAVQLYRDALGLVEVYNERIEQKGDDGKPKIMHLVILRGNDKFIGLLGLLQYIDPKVKPKHENARHIGDAILIFNTDEQQKRFDAVKKVPGIEIASEPHLVEYPSKKGPIKVMFSSFYDPNGVYVELNQMLP